jgi:hypothetical protein
MGPLYGETPVPEPSSTCKPMAYEPSPKFPSEAPKNSGAHLQSLLLHLQVVTVIIDFILLVVELYI